jgi:FAD/FMN-containing dehydrogenase
VVQAVQAAVDSRRKIAVRSGGHCYENFVADAAVRAVIDLSSLNEVGYDSDQHAFFADAGATLDDVYKALYKGWGVTLPPGTAPPSARVGTSPRRRLATSSPPVGVRITRDNAGNPG